MRAIVVGAGIGGLSAAIALRRVGVEATVFERASELKEIGAGISLWANAMKALSKLDLYDEVRAVGWPSRPDGAEGRLEMEARSWRGEVLYKVLPVAAMKERFGEIGVILLRPDLQKVLLSALGEAGGEVRLGAKLVGFEQDCAGSIVARIADGREERGDLIVGADGLRSVVRAQLLDDGPPLYAGYGSWRGLVWLTDDPVPGRAGFFSSGQGKQFGLVRLGQRCFYWFATKNAPEWEWNAARGRSKQELLTLFDGWYERIPAIIKATEETDIHRDALFYREPAEHWGKGRVTLLGDAAHPMTPDLGQGACQAIEDAVVLARCLQEEGEVEAALKLYEARRIERTAQVVRQSRRLGLIWQLENAFLWRIRDAAFKALPERAHLRMQLRQLDPVLDYEV